MTELCQDPLRYLVEGLCCRVYLDGGGNVRLGFSRRHDLKDMMTAQGLVRSHVGVLRDRLRQGGNVGEPASDPAAAPAEDCFWAGHVAAGTLCPLI